MWTSSRVKNSKKPQSWRGWDIYFCELYLPGALPVLTVKIREKFSLASRKGKEKVAILNYATTFHS